MSGHEQVRESRVAKVESEETWNMFIAQACPVVVHFSACWCMPSVAMKPVFEELAFNHRDILFLTVDVDETKEVASKMEIKAMPTFLLMKDGKVVDKIIGANPDEIKKRVGTLIN